MRAAGTSRVGATHAFALACVVCATQLASATAGAQSASAAVDAGAETEARALYAAGQAAFHDGRYQHALEYLQRSYELSHRPALLYNLGTTYDRLRRDREALDAFEQYLREVPNAENTSEVQARIAVLREALARTTAEPTPTPEPVVTRPPRPSRWSRPHRPPRPPRAAHPTPGRARGSSWPLAARSS